MDVFESKLNFKRLSFYQRKTNFTLDLGLDKVDIGQTFTLMNTLKTIAIGDVVNGKMNSTIKLNGTLNQSISQILTQYLEI